MPGPIDHIAFLSQEIGPRPSGTEEEQQAALYITEQLQKDAGLPAEIEDFNSQANEELPRAICVLLTMIFAIASMIFPVMVIPGLIVCLLTGALYCAETFDKPIISRFLSRGVSQNIVSRYEPQYSAQGGGTRRRKIILLANYDSGKVRSELSSPILGILPILQKISLGAMIFLPLFLLVRCLFFLHAEDGLAITLNIITVFALILAAIPLVLAVMHRFSSYNDAANSNAAGVASLLEIARRIGKERYMSSDYADPETGEVHIHGEDAARASGLVPEGARLTYEAQQMHAPELSPQSEAERLSAAKAAIAAMTGRAVSHTEHSSIADHLVQVRSSSVRAPEGGEIAEIREDTREALMHAPQNESGPSALSDAAQAKSEALPEQQSVEKLDISADINRGPSAGSDAVPDWFKKAQENAKKKPVSDSSKVVRSRYAAALDAAVAESSNYFNQANNAVNEGTEERIKKMRDGIMEVSAPQRALENFEAKKVGLAARKEAREHVAPAQNEIDERVEKSMPVKQATSNNDQPLEKMASPIGEPVTSDREPGEKTDNVREVAAEKKQSRGLNVLIPENDASLDLGSTTAMPPLNIEELRYQTREEVISEEPTSGGKTNQILYSDELNEEFVEEFDAQEEPRKPIELPSIKTATTQMAPIDTSKMQRAPLAQAEESKQGAAKSLLNMLPSINVNDQDEETQGEEQSASAPAVFRSSLKNNLPSLSGALKTLDQDEDIPKSTESIQNTSSVSTAGSFASSGATGTFSPVGDELLEGVAPEDIYIDDADDSEYEGGFTESGAFAGPGYVEMPRSRARRFFDKLRFRKNKKEEEEVSAKEWLDVDEDFDAREVGKERGGWESFQEEKEAFDNDFDADVDNEWTPDERNDAYRRPNNDWEGGAVRSRAGEESVNSSEHTGGATGSMDVSQPDEMQKIQHFRNPGFSTEVWFVALGSELANNGGMHAFLREHEQDLKGSIMVNLNALGAGELSYLSKEGFTGKAGASSRMKRYIKKASQALGMNIEPTTIRWKESAATVAANKGLQAVTIVGMDGNKPAGFAQSDDVLENIDHETLESNIDFVTELIRSI